MSLCTSRRMMSSFVLIPLPMRVFILLFLMASTWAPAQTVTRGPYLQLPTNHSIIVRWRTDMPTISRVHFSTALSGLSSQYTGTPALVTHHSVTVNFLQPMTEYFFGISDGVNIISGEDSTHRFTTWPIPGGDEPVRVWAIGDFGKGNSEQAQVKHSLMKLVMICQTSGYGWVTMLMMKGRINSFKIKYSETTPIIIPCSLVCRFYPAREITTTSR